MDGELTHFHQRALLAVGTALTQHDQKDAWLDLENILRARLTPYERACLLASVAVANEPDLLFDVLDAVVPARLFGVPMPAAFEIEADARWWAEQATPPELKAWITACFVRLPPKDQAGFLAAAARRDVA